ncbi:MAG: MiaB/RimO family radical SAM methylthiotransferase [Magnetococcales bacterium]|nr:MiaB/RimO family radical SAM methylthiotransferase [Magnetococcales bacterium]
MPPLIEGFADRSRAFLSVQTGCDGHCSYCLIPQTRGPSRSLTLEHVLAQAKSFLASGFRELVLTGIDLGAWGRDLPGSTGGLASLVGEIARLPGLDRLRLSSLDPSDLDEPLLALFADRAVLCDHLHLSIQSGDDAILASMGRRYQRRQILDAVGELRRLRPELILGGDFIVGFPGEDEAAFARSLDLVERTGLLLAHVFRYSDRPGTEAARINPSTRVPPSIMRDRSRRLRDLAAAALRTETRRWVGRRIEVLVESCAGGEAFGKSRGFLPVRFPTISEPLPGEIAEVEIVAIDPGKGGLIGRKKEIERT